MVSTLYIVVAGAAALSTLTSPAVVVVTATNVAVISAYSFTRTIMRRRGTIASITWRGSPALHPRGEVTSAFAGDTTACK